MNFEHFRRLVDGMFNNQDDTGVPMVKYKTASPGQLPPLVLAYIGDAYFTLFVRTKLLGYEQKKVRVLHEYDSKIVSAVMQAAALRAIERNLTEEELAVVRRGRNAKSSVPKSATVSDYRYSTGFEALLGFLFLSQKHERLVEVADMAFVYISREMTKKEEK